MEILIAIAILGGLGLIFGLVLAAASKIFYVETDPRLEKLNECRLRRICRGSFEGRSRDRQMRLRRQ